MRWGILTFSMVLFFNKVGQAQQPNPTNGAKLFNLTKQLAIEGYDPVAYFTQQKAIKGNPDNEFQWQGVKYRFSSKQHLDLFKQTPSAYLPQYGGWCAYAMGSSGEKVEVDPKTFKIIHSKLYLFYNAYFTNTLTKWNKNESSLMPQADKNWQRIINK